MVWAALLALPARAALVALPGLLAPTATAVMAAMVALGILRNWLGRCPATAAMVVAVARLMASAMVAMAVTAVSAAMVALAPRFLKGLPLRVLFPFLGSASD
jgi:hypothetical protein